MPKQHTIDTEKYFSATSPQRVQSHHTRLLPRLEQPVATDLIAIYVNEGAGWRPPLRSGPPPPAPGEVPGADSRARPEERTAGFPGWRPTQRPGVPAPSAGTAVTVVATGAMGRHGPLGPTSSRFAPVPRGRDLEVAVATLWVLAHGAPSSGETMRYPTRGSARM